VSTKFWKFILLDGRMDKISPKHFTA